MAKCNQLTPLPFKGLAAACEDCVKIHWSWQWFLFVCRRGIDVEDKTRKSTSFDKQRRKHRDDDNDDNDAWNSVMSHQSQTMPNAGTSLQPIIVRQHYSLITICSLCSLILLTAVTIVDAHLWTGTLLFFSIRTYAPFGWGVKALNPLKCSGVR